MRLSSGGSSLSGTGRRNCPDGQRGHRPEPGCVDCLSSSCRGSGTRRSEQASGGCLRTASDCTGRGLRYLRLCRCPCEKHRRNRPLRDPLPRLRRLPLACPLARRRFSLRRLRSFVGCAPSSAALLRRLRSFVGCAPSPPDPSASEPLQCTHLMLSSLRKVIPLFLRGITLHKSLTVSCVRCSTFAGLEE